MNDPQRKSCGAGRPNFDLTEDEKALLTKQCESWPTSSGKTQYMRYLQGVKLTHMEMCLAKCAECCGGYVDGRYDCEVAICPQYQSMPYRGKFDPESSNHLVDLGSYEINTITSRQNTFCDGKEIKNV